MPSSSESSTANVLPLPAAPAAEADGVIEHGMLLLWMLFIGVMLFCLFVAWREGLLAILFASDRSRICWLIALLFVGMNLHCAHSVVALSVLNRHIVAIGRLLERHGAEGIVARGRELHLGGQARLPRCAAADCMREVLAVGAEREAIAALLEQFTTQLRRPQDVGWFVCDLLIKLGLLGTIVGFILMLASVSNISDFDAASIQFVLLEMSSGMATALYTTLAGLVGSLLLAAQYHLLDRYADEAVNTTHYLIEMHLVAEAAR